MINYREGGHYSGEEYIRRWKQNKHFFMLKKFFWWKIKKKTENILYGCTT